ncbi:MAG: Lrp/AsnC family transcriptional regulator [Burkholderiales bacterium]
MNAADEAIVRATQGGLPLAAAPYEEVARAAGLTEAEVTARLRAMLADGRIRRIGAVPNHYALGYAANGMSVWDVDDEAVDVLGARVGALPFVTHSYRRPRRLPCWRYNLFAMVHGRSRAETDARVQEIRALLEPALRAYDVIYSTRILKKTGMRLY